MNKRILNLFFPVILLAGGSSIEAIASIEAGVVRITSVKDGETGTGFVRCITGNTAFIVTANHVVDDSVHCHLEFYGQGRAGSVGEVLYVSTNDDVAILATEIPRGIDVGSFSLYTGEIDRGTEAFVCGFPQGGGAWRTFIGTFEAIRDGFLEVTAPGAFRGNSGGPVLIDHKVVGMVVRTRSRSGQRRIQAVPASILNEHLRSAVVCVESANKVTLGTVGFSEKALARLESWFPDADAADELATAGMGELRIQLREQGIELADWETASVPKLDIRVTSFSRAKRGKNYNYSTVLVVGLQGGSSGGRTFSGSGGVPQLDGVEYNLGVVKTSLKKAVRHALETMILEWEEQ